MDSRTKDAFIASKLKNIPLVSQRKNSTSISRKTTNESYRKSVTTVYVHSKNKNVTTTTTKNHIEATTRVKAQSNKEPEVRVKPKFVHVNSTKEQLMKDFYVSLNKSELNSFDFQRNNQFSIGKLKKPTTTTKSKDNWALFQRLDGKMSFFEAMVLAANILVVSTILLVILISCLKSNKRKKKLTNQEKLGALERDFSIEEARTVETSDGEQVGEEPIAVAVVSSSSSSSSSNLQKNLPQSNESNKPDLVCETGKVENPNEFSGDQLNQEIVTNKATAIVQPTKESNDTLIDSEKSKIAEKKLPPTGSGSIQNLSSLKEVNSSNITKLRSNSSPDIKLTSECWSQKTSLGAVESEKAADQQFPAGAGKIGGEDKTASWIRIEDKPEMKSKVAEQIVTGEVNGFGLKTIAQPAIDKRIEDIESPDVALSPTEEPSASDQELINLNAINESLSRQLNSDSRKYFVYIVNDGHFTSKKECIAQIELPQNKKITLAELRQIITNSRDVSMTSLKRSKFRFVTETYRLLNENEDSTVLHQVYPTEGVFVKLNDLNSSTNNRGSISLQAPPGGGVKRKSLQDQTNSNEPLPAIEVSLATSTSGLNKTAAKSKARKPAKPLGLNRQKLPKLQVAEAAAAAAGKSKTRAN